MVVTNPADEFPADLQNYVEPDPYKHHPAAFVPSKVPRWRTPPHMNILIQEHHITPHMIKVNLMSKFNTLVDQDLNDIEKFLDICYDTNRLSLEISNSPDNKVVRFPLKFKSILTIPQMYNQLGQTVKAA